MRDSKVRNHTRNLAVIVCVLLLSQQGQAQLDVTQYNIIPVPQKLTAQAGRFLLTGETVIQADKPADATARLLQEMLRPATGYDLAIVRDASSRPAIVLQLAAQGEAPSPEGYTLEVRPDGVRIVAREPAGLFYGVQTLRQLLPEEVFSPQKVPGATWSVPCVTIRDAPRFAWRGLMLDCSRTFWPKKFLLRYIDLLAHYKMNVLHLHLTDDQGWRLEIKRYPKLTEVCSRFADKYNEPCERQGFYTQQEMREIVGYAAQRHVTIVPEIEMPGHCTAVFAAYPELSCTGVHCEIYPFFEGPSITKDVYCAGNEDVFTFLQNVLTEVIDIFPSAYIHVGGDECPKDRWLACPKCQQRMRKEHLADAHELQAYFITRIETFLSGKGRTLIGWDEILEGHLPDRAAVMSWRGVNGGIAAARQGHEVVMSPTSHCYFDYPNEKYTLENVYSFEPIPSQLEAVQQRFILGAQGNMWTHIARAPSEVDQQIFPRLIGLAEVTWSPKDQRDWQTFQARLQHDLKRLEYLNVNWYRCPEKSGTAARTRTR